MHRFMIVLAIGAYIWGALGACLIIGLGLSAAFEKQQLSETWGDVCAKYIILWLALSVAGGILLVGAKSVYGFYLTLYGPEEDTKAYHDK